MLEKVSAIFGEEHRKEDAYALIPERVFPIPDEGPYYLYVWDRPAEAVKT